MINQENPCWTESDDNRLPDEGPEVEGRVYADLSRRYMADIETDKAFSVSGLIRMWGRRHSESGRRALSNIIHGALMIGSFGEGPAWHELRWLQDVIMFIEDDEDEEA